MMIILLTITIMSLIILIFDQYNKDYDELNTLVTRTLVYNYSDESFTSRYSNLFVALKEIQSNFFLIGAGPIHSVKKWYDGGISIILAHGGLMGLISLVLFGYLIIKKAKILVYNFNSNELYKSLLILLFTYLLLSIITEHFLLTRNLLPIATLISVIYADMKQNYASIPMMQSHFN